MHCKACVLLCESEAGEVSEGFSARASLRTRSVRVRGDFGDKPPEEIAEELSKALSQHSLSTTIQQRHIGWDEFGVAVPAAISRVALFVLMRYLLGCCGLASGNASTYGTAFVVGVAASLSTCAALVGGLVLSISATFARSGHRAKPQALFHAGRVASFFVLLGAIGLLGSALRLQSTGTFWLDLDRRSAHARNRCQSVGRVPLGTPASTFDAEIDIEQGLGHCRLQQHRRAGAGGRRDVLPAVRLHSSDAVLCRVNRQRHYRRSDDALLRPGYASRAGAVELYVGGGQHEGI